jgi:hypothetical protein
MGAGVDLPVTRATATQGRGKEPKAKRNCMLRQFVAVLPLTVVQNIPLAMAVTYSLWRINQPLQSRALARLIN